MNIKVINLISGVNGIWFLIQHESCERKMLDSWSSYKDDYMRNPGTCNCKCNKACKIDEYLDIKNWSCKKHLFGKLVLACEDKIWNTPQTSLDDKKV